MVKRHIKKSPITIFSTLLFIVITCQTVAAKPKIKISRPRKHMVISDYKFGVKGKAKKIPEGVFLWVCLQEDGKKQWKPQSDTLALDDGYFKTQAYVIFEGIDDREKATKINVGIIGVDKAGDDVLKKYMKDGLITDKYPYIDLPPGAQVFKMRKIRYIAE